MVKKKIAEKCPGKVRENMTMGGMKRLEVK